jgi:glucokinase
MILAGDVGGTKTVLGLATNVGGAPRVDREEIFGNDEYPSFDDLLDDFLAGSRPVIDVACLAVAGPVLDGRVSMTNLPWEIEARALGKKLGAAHAHILNDLEATALAMLDLPPDALHQIQAGTTERGRGHVVVLAPGTGLGEAMLYWDGAHHHPVASEGGHADFAPIGPEQAALLAYLADRYEHVSYERVLSGPGLVSIYEFLRDTGRAASCPAVERTISEPAAAISTAALNGSAPICTRALDLFVRILGAKAGNLALQAVATGGVFVAGGIAPKILPVLGDGRVREAFVAKGRHRRLLDRIPFHVALEPRASFLGAARFALQVEGAVSA